MGYENSNTAYLIGVAIGDGNLSNPNGRAVRLRITCDNKYPQLQEKIRTSLRKLFPYNFVSITRRRNCSDVSCYSNDLEEILGWQWNMGSKYKQNIRVPNWILMDKECIKRCLCGLFETDGSVYNDRGYIYVNFTTIIHGLSQDVQIMIDKIGYISNTQSIRRGSTHRKFTTRISKNAEKFMREVGIQKI